MTTAAEHSHTDEVGLAWRDTARAAHDDQRWEDIPPLPAWDAPGHVEREVFGAYLFDREAGVIHRVAAAEEGCRLDQIKSATFIHWWHEVLEHVPGATCCPTCLSG